MSRGREPTNPPKWALSPQLQEVEALRVLSVGQSVWGEDGILPSPRFLPAGVRKALGSWVSAEHYHCPLTVEEHPAGGVLFSTYLKPHWAI